MKLMRFGAMPGMFVASCGILSHRSGLEEREAQLCWPVLPTGSLPELVSVGSPYFLAPVDEPNGDHDLVAF